MEISRLRIYDTRSIRMSQCGNLHLLQRQRSLVGHHYSIRKQTRGLAITLGTCLSPLLLEEPAHLSVYGVRAAPFSKPLHTVFAPPLVPSRSLQVCVADADQWLWATALAPSYRKATTLKLLTRPPGDDNTGYRGCTSWDTRPGIMAAT